MILCEGELRERARDEFPFGDFLKIPKEGNSHVRAFSSSAVFLPQAKKYRRKKKNHPLPRITRLRRGFRLRRYTAVGGITGFAGYTRPPAVNYARSALPAFGRDYRLRRL